MSIHAPPFVVVSFRFHSSVLISCNLFISIIVLLYFIITAKRIVSSSLSFVRCVCVDGCVYPPASMALGRNTFFSAIVRVVYSVDGNETRTHAIMIPTL